MAEALPREQQSAWQRWELSSLKSGMSVDAEAAAQEERETLARTAEAEARAQGFAQGHAAGLAAARGETERLVAVLAMLSDHAGNHEQRLAEEVLDLALGFARQLVGEALATRRELILPLVASALRQLPQATQRVELRLNPVDVATVRERLASEIDAPRVTFVPDPSIAPGGCQLDTDQASVDATPAARWRRLLAGLGRNDDWLEPL